MPGMFLSYAIRRVRASDHLLDAAMSDARFASAPRLRRGAVL